MVNNFTFTMNIRLTNQRLKNNFNELKNDKNGKLELEELLPLFKEKINKNVNKICY